MNLDEALAIGPVIAILRGVRPDEVASIAEVLLAEGIAAIEVPLNSPEPLVSIERLAQAVGGSGAIGAGTVLDPADVARCLDAGATYLVSPHFDPAVVGAVAGAVHLPGVATPSEAMAARRAGCRRVKVFPADVVTTAGIRAWSAVLPDDLELVAVSGIDADNAGAYLAAGARAVGVGGSLFRPGDDPATVSSAARRLVGALS